LVAKVLSKITLTT